jgi:calcium-dependent protein kinase
MINKIFKKIGEGDFSTIFLIKSKHSNEIRCLKRIFKPNLEDIEAIKTELKILSDSDNPYIITVIEVFSTNLNFDIVMEFCEGGSLFDRINLLLSKNKCFTADQAAEIIRQIIIALNYAHANNIVHRDIKLENILFLNKDENDFRLKIIDFGLSKYFDGKRRMKEKQGTIYYISPEILKGNYDEKCDIWSSGVLLYIMLIGVPPFFSEIEGDDESIYKKIKACDYKFENKCNK